MAFDKIYTGADMRPLSNREIKAFVMRSRGINSEEYQKLYDRTRNKVRNYEKVTGQKIGNVSHYLYTLELDKQTGREHYQSRQKDLIEHAPTLSTGISVTRLQKAYVPYIDYAVRRDFMRLIEEDPVSNLLAHGITDKNELISRVKSLYPKEAFVQEYLDMLTLDDLKFLITGMDKSEKTKRELFGYQGQELKEKLTERAAKIAEARKKKKQAVNGDDDIFDDTDYAFNYSEV